MALFYGMRLPRESYFDKAKNCYFCELVDNDHLLKVVLCKKKSSQLFLLDKIYYKGLIVWDWSIKIDSLAKNVSKKERNVFYAMLCMIDNFVYVCVFRDINDYKDAIILEIQSLLSFANIKDQSRTLERVLENITLERSYRFRTVNVVKPIVLATFKDATMIYDQLYKQKMLKLASIQQNKRKN